MPGARDTETEIRNDSADTVMRYDSAPLQKPSRTAQGFLRVDAVLTKAGIFTYLRADGTTQREYRPSSTVLDPTLLESLAGAPVTDDHPSEGLVTPENHSALAIGHAGDVVRRDGDTAVARLTITDAKAIAKVERGQLAEVSLGYRARVIPQAGEVGGERYDAIQHVVSYNHIALGPKGWGRAGPEVKLRLDASSAVMVDASSTSAAPAALPRSAPMNEILLRLDGVDIKLAETNAQIVKKAIDSRDTALAEKAKALDGLHARFDSMKTELDAAKADLARAKDPQAIQALVSARAALEADARKVLGADVKLDGKTEDEVKRAAIAKAKPSIKLDGKSADYVSAMFDAIVVQHDATASETKNDAADEKGNIGDAARAALDAQGGTRAGEVKTDAKDPRAELYASQEKRGRAPLKTPGFNS